MAKLNCCLLSGLNAGASISFDIGSYTLGHGAAPFLALDDESLEPIHLSFEVVPAPNVEKGLYLMVIPHGPCFINGEEILEKTQLKEGELLSFGINELMIEEEGKSFYDLLNDAKNIKEIIRAAELANAAEAASARAAAHFQSDNVGAAAIDATGARISGESDDLKVKHGSAEPVSEGANETTLKEPRRQLKFRERFPLISGICLMLIGIGILSWLLYMMIIVPGRSVADTKEDLITFLRENHVTHIVIDDSKGFLKASGMVENQASKEKILKHLPALNETVVLNLTTAEAYNLDIERAFKIRGAFMRTYWDADGKLRVRGYVQDSRAEVALISSVKSILPNDVHVKADFVYEADIKPLMDDLIAKDDYLRNLQIKFIFTPLAIAYSSPNILIRDEKFIEFKKELIATLDTPLDMADASVVALSYLNLISTITNGRANSDEIAPFDRELVYDYKIGVIKLAPYANLLGNYDLERGGIDLKKWSDPEVKALSERVFHKSPTFTPHGDQNTNPNKFASLLDNLLGTPSKGANSNKNVANNAVGNSSIKPPKGLVSLNKLNDEIQSVTFKPLKFITLKSGAKVFIGGILPTGHQVKDIALDHLVLVDENGEVFNYELK